MRRRGTLIAGVVALLALPVGALAQGVGPAVPIPEGPHDEPTFIGERATPNPVSMPPVPEHPFMAPNGRSNLHVDAYASDVNEWIGPIGRKMARATNGQFAECASVTFDSRGRIVTICVGLAAPRLELLDPETLDILAVMILPNREPGLGNPFTEFGGGGYFYLDNEDRAVIPTNDRHIYVVEQTGGVSSPGFNQVSDYDLNPVLADDDVIVSALPDFSGNIWFAARSGIVGFVDPSDGSLHSFDTGEGITNSFALDETGGVYIVTDTALYRFDVDAGEPSQTWREVYPNNGVQKPGQVDDGSGTTPTLMGTRYIAINDNLDPMNVVVYDRRASVSGSREICSQAVFPPGMSATDNSLIGTDRSIIVENNYGYEGPSSTEAGGTTAPGVARIDIDAGGTGCTLRWVSQVNSPTVVPKLSLANGLVYVYAKKPETRDPWYLTAIDFRTGETVYQRLSGVGLGFNNNYAPITIGPDGSAYIGVLDGIVRLVDAESSGGGGGGDDGGDGDDGDDEDDSRGSGGDSGGGSGAQPAARSGPGSIPFTGLALGPLLIGGLAMLAGGAALRGIAGLAQRRNRRG